MNQATTSAVIAPKLMTVKISAMAGIEDVIIDGKVTREGSKETAVSWIGRKVGKAARKDLHLSCAIPKIAAAQIAALDAEKVATIINDEWLAYIRRVKCQRLDIGSSIELTFPELPNAYAQTVINMLSAPAERAKKLVSTSTIRALLLDEGYKLAATAVMGSKLEAWKRIGEKEMMPLTCAQDAKVATARSTARDNAVLRMVEIAAQMPDSEHKTVLEGAAEILAELETIDLDDSI